MIEPFLIVCGVGIGLLLVDLVLPHGKKHLTAYLALAGVVWALIRSTAQWGVTATGYSGMVSLDNLSTVFNVLFLASTGVVILLSMPFLRRDDVERSGSWHEPQSRSNVADVSTVASRRSRMSVLRPPLASSAAATRPLWPPPMTTTSVFTGGPHRPDPSGSPWPPAGHWLP
jgi:hypothetical protein